MLCLLLQKGCVSQEEMVTSLLQQTGPCCTVTDAARTLISRVTRLFFMSERQDLSLFLVTDLGITRYPQYRHASGPFLILFKGNIILSAIIGSTALYLGR